MSPPDVPYEQGEARSLLQIMLLNGSAYADRPRNSPSPYHLVFPSFYQGLSDPVVMAKAAQLPSVLCN